MPHLLRLFLLAFFLHCPAGLATTVYKSMDENGVVSFSDTLPDDSPAVETFEITIHETASSDSTELLEEMRQTTDRMAADRREREKHRAEMRQLQSDTARQKNNLVYPAYYDTITSNYSEAGSYYRYPLKRPAWPRHPIARPPLRPPNHANTIEQFPAPHIRPLFTPRTRGANRQ
jgi:hypothetical protein